jgi:hypothetical protein
MIINFRSALDTITVFGSVGTTNYDVTFTNLDGQQQGFIRGIPAGQLSAIPSCINCGEYAAEGPAARLLLPPGLARTDARGTALIEIPNAGSLVQGYVSPEWAPISAENISICSRRPSQIFYNSPN